MFQISGKNSTQFCRMILRRVIKIPSPSPPFSKTEELRDIGDIIDIGDLILGVNSVTVSYLIHYDSLLQNTTVITKCDSYFITKCTRNLLQNASEFLLQNATVITNCDNFITKCDSYYKMRCLLQIATVQSPTKTNSLPMTAHFKRIFLK